MVKFSKKTFIIVIIVAILALSIVAGGIAYANWDKTSKALADFNVGVSGNTVLSVETTAVESQLKLLPETAEIVDDAKETKKLKVATFTTSIDADPDDVYSIRWTFTECKMKDGDQTKDYRDLFNVVICPTGTENVWAADTYIDTVQTDVTYDAYITMKDPTDNGYTISDIADKSFVFKITLDIELTAKINKPSN